MYIKVIACPRSKKESIKELSQNRFEIKVKEKAEKNMANERIIEMVAEYFEVGVRDIKIINGHHHSSKLISIKKDLYEASI